MPALGALVVQTQLNCLLYAPTSRTAVACALRATLLKTDFPCRQIATGHKILYDKVSNTKLRYYILPNRENLDNR
jgi:hypothetical protein